jgi:hypothetical protein
VNDIWEQRCQKLEQKVERLDEMRGEDKVCASLACARLASNAHHGEHGLSSLMAVAMANADAAAAKV